MKFKPLGARALVKEVEREQTTESGIVLPDTAKEKPQNAEVVAVGTHDEVSTRGHILSRASVVASGNSGGPTQLSATFPSAVNML